MKILFVIICTLLCGCTTVTTEIFTDWTQTQLPASSMEWHKIQIPSDINRICGIDDVGLVACAHINKQNICIVYSTLSEEQAKKGIGPLNYTDVYAHEKEHCNGRDHRKKR